MDIVFQCSHCGRNLVADESEQGESIDCPACGKPLVIPSPSHKTAPPKRVIHIRREPPEEEAAEAADEAASTAAETQPMAAVTEEDEEPRYMHIFVGWICVVIGVGLALLLPHAFLIYTPFFVGSFVMSLALMSHRRMVHGITLLICTIIPFPLLMQENIWKNLSAWPQQQAHRVQKLVFDAAGQPKLTEVEVEEAPPVQVASAPAPTPTPAATPRPTRRAAAVDIPTRWDEDEKYLSDEPPDVEGGAPSEPAVRVRTRAPSDQYRELLENTQEIPPLVPEDQLANTTLGRGPDFLWQRPSTVTMSADQPPPLAEIPFVIYNEGGEARAYSPSGKMGNAGALQIDETWDVEPHEGKTCIRMAYAGSFDWVTTAWQNPALNWGDVPGGYNFTNAAKVTFWARGEKGGERAEFMAGMEQPQNAVSRDSLRATTGSVKLRNQWKKYSIPLQKYDRGRLITAFLVRIEAEKDPIIIYLDDIQYE